MKIVIDTSIIISALRSSRGASHRILLSIGVDPRLTTFVSVPLILEYEDVAKRQSRQLGLPRLEIETVIDYLCSVSQHQRVFYLWRPFLKDPRDDFILELAVAAACRCIVTHNVRDFKGCELFGVAAMTPQQLLGYLEGTS
ncbi:MAG TPA: putative toxin-antitoxin system toxin component, PIN family [Candidatus Kapabacteria bacterium]|nr:putative toxin-antitoxin system toxin component, PIN family [Candidatus Kapabacteria bacterium]